VGHDQIKEVAAEIIDLNVRQNAYDFLEEALRYADLASEDAGGWKFAIVLGAQGIELLLKARLALEHPLLVQADPDRPAPGPTVGVDAAIKRLAAAGVALAKEDVERLRRARRLRNEFVHYEVHATQRQSEAAFADLLEFAHVFHFEHLGTELHDHLSQDLYEIEAATMAKYQRDFVVYQGSEVIRWFPSEIVDAQFALRVSIGDHLFNRIRRGSPHDLVGERDGPCHDCNALKGQLHAWGCDSERCPNCSGQMLGCDCEWEWHYAEETEHFVEPTREVKHRVVSDPVTDGDGAT